MGRRGSVGGLLGGVFVAGWAAVRGENPPFAMMSPCATPDANARAAAGAKMRAGSVPYLNVAPLVWGLAGRLRLLPPAQLAVALRRGEIDAGLLSITESLFHETYDILDGPCVASDGDVFSVFLAHRGRLEEVREIHCDTASLTSVNLARVLLAERGLRPALVPLEDYGTAERHDCVLLIGDPAIAFHRAGHPHAIWDLGSAWKEATGLPFVYAVWAIRRDAESTELRRELREAAERGQRELEAVIRDSPEFDEPFRRAYLTQHTRHFLGPREKAGVARFAELLRCHGDRPVYPPRYVR